MRTDLFTLKQATMEMAELGALAVLKHLTPSFDEVKSEEAYKLAGSRDWLRWHVKAGNIKGYRKGVHQNSAVYYSRMEIAALVQAEREMKFSSEEYRAARKEDRTGGRSPQVIPTNKQPQSTIPAATDQLQSRFQRDFTSEQQRQLYEAMKVGMFISDSLDFSFFCEVLNNEYH